MNLGNTILSGPSFAGTASGKPWKVLIIRSLGILAVAVSVLAAIYVIQESISSVFGLLYISHARDGLAAELVRRDFYFDAPLMLTIPLICWAIARKIAFGVRMTRLATAAAFGGWLAAFLVIKTQMP